MSRNEDNVLVIRRVTLNKTSMVTVRFSSWATQQHVGAHCWNRPIFCWLVLICQWVVDTDKIVVLRMNVAKMDTRRSIVSFWLEYIDVQTQQENKSETLLLICFDSRSEIWSASCLLFQFTSLERETIINSIYLLVSSCCWRLFQTPMVVPCSDLWWISTYVSPLLSLSFVGIAKTITLVVLLRTRLRFSLWRNTVS